MLYEAIDTLFIAVDDLAAASSSYERLGLRLTPDEESQGLRSRSFVVGPETHRVAARLLTDQGAVTSDHALVERVRQACAAKPGLVALALRVSKLAAVAEQLTARGLLVEPLPPLLRDGRAVASLAWLPVREQAATDLVLIEYARSGEPRSVSDAAAGMANAFALKRLDHLAAVAHDLDVKTHFWTDVLGVPVAGQVTTPTMIIRQFRIGDAVMELLGPAAADSPLHQRPPGLVSMAAWEVEHLAAAVAQARAAGFTVPDPATGVLPGTRTATIPAPELGGVAMQLLQFVRSNTTDRQ